MNCPFRIQKYFRTVGELSDLLCVERIGLSSAGRNLVLGVVTFAAKGRSRASERWDRRDAASQ
jgi:hypothetical protein